MRRYETFVLAAILVGGFTPMTKATPVQWPVAEGGNGHFYEAFSVSAGISWTNASQLANLKGGYLVTITSQAENDFVYNLINYEMYWDGPSGPWIGGYQPPGSPEPAGGWRWVTDEPFIYTNWNDQQPNEFNGNNENRIHFGYTTRTPFWNDVPDTAVTVDGRRIRGYIVETIPEPVTYYVDDDAPPGGNGRDWLTAFKHLQNALIVAAVGNEVWVAQGTYKPDEGGGQTPGDREATFQLKNGVTIKGGYVGCGQPDPNTRDIVLYETTLTGDLLGNDGQNFVNYRENSYHVVTGSGTYKTAVLDGFTITGGNADENQNVPRGWGGGMYNNNGSPTVTNCTLSRNWSGWDGGGMHNRESSTPTVTNCTFIGNSAKYAGGMYHRRNSNSTITNCIFSGNSARTDGGGMFNYESSSPILTNCTFIENSAEVNGGGMKNEIFSSPVLTDCTFTDNSAGVCGGGMLSNSEISPLLKNCTFINNSSGICGGGIYNGHNERYDYSELTLMNCTFKGNWAVVNGGAIDNSDNTASTIVNCIFTGNIAGESGGGISSWVNSRQTLTNCTFSGNSASNGGGMYNNSSSPTVTNCVLWGNTALTGPQIDIYGTSSAIVSYSDVQGSWLGEGNIDVDPCFVEPAIGDYHLLPGSPCIDAGDNSAIPPSVVFDLDGNYRIANGTVDMGVYEFGSTPPPSTLFVDARAAGANDGSSWENAFNDLQEGLSFAAGTFWIKEIRVAQGAYSPEGPLPDIRQASNPNPVDGSLGVSTNADLSWTAGLGAVSHDVYFGTTSSPPFVCNQTSTTFDPGTMAFCTNYYWRIDEVNDSVIATGDIWSFVTMMSPPPFESSNEDERIEPAADRTATFQLKNGVVIKGGYAGFGKSDPNARDIKVYETILTGDIGILDDNSDNSYHVVTGTGCDETAVLDGFTITAGNANDDYPSPHSCGGGMYNYFGSPTLKNCTFSGNSASRDGGGMFNSEQSNPTLANCTFTGNSTIYDGGAMCNRTSSPTITNCTFMGNSANHGAGISNWPGSPILTACTFSGNSAELGGAVFNWDSSPILANCIFGNNSAREWGGAICNLSNSSPTLVNSTFNGNLAGDRGNGMNNRINSRPMVTNCIFWDGGDEIYNTSGSTTAITYSDVQGGWPGEGNISADPCFVDSEDEDYHLLGGSPCIDAGDNNSLPPDSADIDSDGDMNEPIPFDLDGNPRIIGTVVDMGVYEFQNTPPVADAVDDQIFECACNTAEGTKVTLDGSGSYDADGDPLTYTWTGPFIGSPAHGATPTVTLEAGCPDDYVITLVVNDGTEDSEPNKVVITVVDTTPPDINCPLDVILECPSDTTPSATGKATGTDTCGTVMITHSDQWQPGCGNTGILTRMWTSTDESGNISTCVQTITVVDTTAPDFELSISPTMLWPPDHKMYEIAPSWTVSDECDTTPDVSLVGIVANEGDNTIGDGHTTDDIQINEDGSIYLRSERSGTGHDRVYTITYQAVDDCGNTTVRSATVSIPHDFKVLARIASRWLWAGPGRIPEDLNGDGIVNFTDFARFAGNWIK